MKIYRTSSDEWDLNGLDTLIKRLTEVLDVLKMDKFRKRQKSVSFTDHRRGGCGQNPGHLNEVIYGIYSPTNYCSIKTV